MESLTFKLPLALKRKLIPQLGFKLHGFFCIQVERGVQTEKESSLWSLTMWVMCEGREHRICSCMYLQPDGNHMCSNIDLRGEA